jgi:predicted pyridoxine 5'-phosphate oxidase superfamily flavin-nucleotide-binding protein
MAVDMTRRFFASPNMERMTEKIEQAMHLAARTHRVLPATVDTTANPRLTPAEQCTPAGEHRIALQAWVEVPLMEDRDGVSRIALLVWDEAGRGYQLAGQLLRQQETAVLDGLAEVERKVHFPQVERFLLMQVNAVEDFYFPAATPSGG